MSEATAGALLRTAREANGLSLGALAAMLKVAQRKLEALEADRLDELPDATFARALAQTVCKALKIDAAPVLAALPPSHGYRLEQLGEGINTPFRARDGRAMARNGGTANQAWWWGAAAIAVAAALVVLVPTSWWSAVRSGHGVRDAQTANAPAADASDSSANLAESPTNAASGFAGKTDVAALPMPEVDPSSLVASAPASSRSASGATPTTGTAPMPSSATSDASLQLRARAQSWVQVQDASGRTLLSRTLAEGEQVAIDATPPVRLKIGNALGTEVRFRGSAVDLTPSTRDNIARLEIKP